MQISSLQSKLLVSVGLIILLVLGVSSYVHIQNLTRNYLEAITWRSEALAQGMVKETLDRYTLNPATKAALGTLSMHCIQLYEANQAAHVAHIAVIDADGIIAAHNDKALWNTPAASPTLQAALQRRRLETIREGATYHTLIPMIAEDKTYIGTISIGLSKHVLDEKVRAIVLQTIGIFVLCAGLACIAIAFLVRMVVTRPIRHIIAAGEKIAQGEVMHPLVTAAIQHKMDARRFNDDEIGALRSVFQAMAMYLQTMTQTAAQIAVGNLHQYVQPHSQEDLLGQTFQTMLTYLQEIAQMAQQIAEGNLSVEVHERSAHDSLMHALNAMLTKLNRTVLEVKAAAQTVALGSQVLNSIAEQLSQGAAQQAAAAQEVSSSMEQMAANIHQNADHARVTEKIAMESAADARQGGQSVAQTIEAMKAIEERISIIQEIAMQTNILSMNATIEASKAQDYGRGFAVVAAEVRNLAHHTRKAAEEMNTLVKSCVHVSEHAGTILQRLVPNSEKTAELVQEINAASNEQSLGAEQVNRALQQLDQVIQENAETAESMAAAAAKLSAQADHLQQATAFFTVRESLLGASASDANLLQTLQTLQTQLIAQGMHEPVVTALIDTVLTASRVKQPDVPKDPPAQPASAQVTSETAHDALAKPPKPGLKTAPTLNAGDLLDNEFERY